MYVQDLRELFLDFNMDTFIDTHDELKQRYENRGFFNDSSSVDFVKLLMECVDINESINLSYNDNSSDDDSEITKKY
jgi:hypothetical protein